MKFKKGDKVQVLIGKDKGRKGKIEKIFPKLKAVMIPGINVYKKHVKPQKEGKPGGIIDIVKPILVSKVALLCPKCGQQTRVGWQLTKTGLPAGKAGKERICKKCKALI